MTQTATTPIRLPVQRDPAIPRSHALTLGALRVCEVSAKDAKAMLARAVEEAAAGPVILGGKVTGRLYVLTPRGASAGFSVAWSITIHDPRKGDYTAGGGVLFDGSREWAIEYLREYRDGCEAAAA